MIVDETANLRMRLIGCRAALKRIEAGAQELRATIATLEQAIAERDARIEQEA